MIIHDNKIIMILKSSLADEALFLNKLRQTDNFSNIYFFGNFNLFSNFLQYLEVCYIYFERFSSKFSFGCKTWHGGFKFLKVYYFILGRFTPIFYFNCEHCKTKQIIVREFYKTISWDFQT